MNRIRVVRRYVWIAFLLSFVATHGLARLGKHFARDPSGMGTAMVILAGIIGAGVLSIVLSVLYAQDKELSKSSKVFHASISWTLLIVYSFIMCFTPLGDRLMP